MKQQSLLCKVQQIMRQSREILQEPSCEGMALLHDFLTALPLQGANFPQGGMQGVSETLRGFLI